MDSDRAPGDMGGAMPPHPLRLTFGQRNSLTALLSQVAESLELVERVEGRPLTEPLRFVAPPVPLSAEQQQVLLELADVLARTANTLADLLHVSLPAAVTTRVVAGHFSVLWSQAEETSPARLRNYGALDPSTVATLRQPLADIARLSLRIAHAVGSGDR